MKKYKEKKRKIFKSEKKKFDLTVYWKMWNCVTKISSEKEIKIKLHN